MADQEQVQVPEPEVSTAKSNLDQLKALPALDKLMKSLGHKNEIRASLAPADLKRAEELAAQLNLDNTDKLHDIARKANEEMTAISKQMIGNTKLGEIDHISDIFAGVNKVGDKLDVSRLHKKPGFFLRQLAKLSPALRKAIDPLLKFLRDYKSVQGEIEKYRVELVNAEAARMTAIEQYKKLRESLFETYKAFEIAIAAAEIVADREKTAWAAKQAEIEARGTCTFEELGELKVTRSKILHLDNRLMRFQNVRMKAMIDLETINMAIDSEEAIRTTLYDLHQNVIPELTRGCAIGIKIYEARQANDLGKAVQLKNQLMQQANVEAVGLLGEEVHETNMRAANEADFIAGLMGKVISGVQKGTANMKQNEAANASAREKLAKVEAEFVQALKEDAKEAADFKKDVKVS